MAAVCVFCSSARDIDPSYLELATEVGVRIGTGGHQLISGGGRVSMMGAVARAARASDGDAGGGMRSMPQVSGPLDA